MYKKTFVTLSLAGFLFAGFLASSKLLFQSCPLDTSCSYFLGLPTCVYGFVMFSVLLVASLMLYAKKGSRAALLTVLLFVSLFGMVFAGFFAVKEIMLDVTHPLLLPTCAYGLVVYLLIFVLSVRGLRE